MMYLNPTEKLIQRESKLIEKFIEDILLLASRIHTLSFNYFKGKLHPQTNKVFFESISSVKDIESLKDYAHEMGYYDLLIIKCYNAMFESTADKIQLLQRIKKLEEDRANNKLTPEQIYFYFGEK